MTDPNSIDSPESFADLPIQPTGSGVADLEIAYEQMRLEQAAEDNASADVAELTPLETGTDAAESAAHPS